MPTIRAATEHDAGPIAHVHVESWRTTYRGIVPDAYLAGLDEVERETLWRDWLARDLNVFVADLDGEIVGFAGGGAIREPLQDYDAELFTIYLLEKAQRRGIGTALLKALAESLLASEFKSMAVWVLKSNSSGHFYARSGALPFSRKEIEIGGATLPVVAYGWPALTDLRTLPPSDQTNMDGAIAQ